MEPSDLKLVWSTLIPYTKEDLEKFKLDGVEGVYRISKKETDGKFYVVLIGSALNLKTELLRIIDENTPFQMYYTQGGDFSFRFAPVGGEDTRKAVEKQMYKQYAPLFNNAEPNSSLDTKVNLN